MNGYKTETIRVFVKSLLNQMNLMRKKLTKRAKTPCQGNSILQLPTAQANSSRSHQLRLNVDSAYAVSNYPSLEIHLPSLIWHICILISSNNIDLLFRGRRYGGVSGPSWSQNHGRTRRNARDGYVIFCGGWTTSV